MTNPFEAIQDKLDDIRAEAIRAVHIAVTREAVMAGLSRLMTLDEGNAAKYKAAVDTIE
jgi:hypothetical protein